MLDESRVEEIVSEVCDHHTRKRNGGFKARCPVCGDSKKNKRLQRLHIDWYQKYEDWVCTCYNAGCEFHSGNIYSLYATVTGSSYNESKKYINQDVYNTEEIKKRLSKSKKRKVCEIPEEERCLDLDLNDCLSIDSVTDDRILLRYLDALKKFVERRGIQHKCFIAHDGRYKNRYIIPIYINDELVYFQGRSMVEGDKTKYLNPEVDKSQIIMNCDKFDPNKSIIVTEGIIDAWMVEGDQGTSSLGAYFSDDIIERLFTMTSKDVILCFDNPIVDKSGRTVLTQFIEESKYRDKVKFFLPNRGDFKDLNELKPLIAGKVYDYVVKNSFSSLNTKVRLSLLYK